MVIRLLIDIILDLDSLRWTNYCSRNQQLKCKHIKEIEILSVVCNFRAYEDDEDNEDDREGGSGEERAFRCKLIADEFKKRRKVGITIIYTPCNEVFL